MSDEKIKEIWVNTFDEKSALKFRDTILEISENDKDQVITIHIDSYGGYVDSLATMIETMNEVPNRFVTTCSGKAMSCGAILLSHGDVRYIGNMSRVMIHNVSSVSWGDVYSLKTAADEAMRLNQVFMGLLAKNCNMSYTKLQQLIQKATDGKEIWLDPEGAKRFGIVDFVGTPKVQQLIGWNVETLPEKLPLKPPKKAKIKRK